MGIVLNIPDDAPRDRIIKVLERVRVLNELIALEEYLIDEEINDA